MTSEGNSVLVGREGCRWARSYLELHEATVSGIAPAEWAAKLAAARDAG